MKKFKLAVAAVLAVSAFPSGAFAEMEGEFEFPLQPLEEPSEAEGDNYVPSSQENISWGELPNRNSEPVMEIDSGETVTFDTVSHEGILEDQGRDPEEYFGQHGVEPGEVLEDAKEIANSDIGHDFEDHGPHVVTGPIAIEGAEPGDVLKVEVLSLEPRVPYGVISNRHYKGALPEEFPENEGPQEGASEENPELYNNVSTFTPIEERDGKWYGEIPGEDIQFPLDPFMGVMGVATDTEEYVHSVPPTHTGGNIDINEMGEGSTLYLPVEVEGGMFFTGDPHFAQGDGEVALTALEASLRGTFRVSVLKNGENEIPGDNTNFDQPFGETEDFWIPIGLDEDLDEAMKEAARESIDYLSEEFDVDRAKAFAYLSAATDYEVSQVVDKTKGIHALIRKEDFAAKMEDQSEGNKEEVLEEGGELPDTASNNSQFMLWGTLIIAASGLLLEIRKRKQM
ncbi:acetamidase/formamidase family protein [Alteribacillus sp. JSM 102045]|uniref:acetamidase/formamidase family protein n=1 Tax=Alteribacillus sp. JSM 102045 TaxID=1562101 RepID=UPI0035C05A84